MCLEVWTILTLGKQPRAWHCFTMEKVAEMIAWLATIAARVAITKTGQYTASAKELSTVEHKMNLFILQILGQIMSGIRSTTNQVLNRRNCLELMRYFLTEKQPDPCIVLRDKGIQQMQTQSAQTQNIRTNTSNRWTTMIIINLLQHLKS